MNRRKLLLSLLAASSASASIRAFAAATTPRIAHPGLQLYTVRAEMQKDFTGTLRALAAMGYEELEFAGYYERKPAEIRALLGELKLSSPSAHVGDALFGPDADKTIEAALTIGHRFLVCPWVDPKQWRDLDAWKRRAEAFNKAGELCHKAGLQFCYHNHHFEFSMLDGQQPYELLLQRCDPQLVKMELDLYWAAAARQDPLALLRKHPGRFPMVHLKQLSALPALAQAPDVLSMNMDDAHRTMTEVGPGLIDFKALLADPASRQIEHFFVEHDAAKAPMESAAASLRFVKSL
jgi:sugar phosphate isomerase/epimerase